MLTDYDPQVVPVTHAGTPWMDLPALAFCFSVSFTTKYMARPCKWAL